ncbi:cortexin-1 isoform X1 [Alligator mississippiensis]|uniref:cortexin-1 isoform X1 n=1 Tax=Alligator mississippiensis TaxID=8496 RepID=UPI0028779DC7|nr:cortexin-1 isoform X1 [Alligator mississippiensis]
MGGGGGCTSNAGAAPALRAGPGWWPPPRPERGGFLKRRQRSRSSCAARRARLHGPPDPDQNSGRCCNLRGTVLCCARIHSQGVDGILVYILLALDLGPSPYTFVLGEHNPQIDHNTCQLVIA